MARSIDTWDKYINSRDVIARIEDLQQDKEWLEEAIEEAKEALETAQNELAECIENGNEDESLQNAVNDAQESLETAENSLAEWLDSDDATELQNLEALQDEAERYCDWTSGETLIREDAFEDYAKELLEDIGALPRDIPDYVVIDWQATADNLKAGYTEVDFDGTTYLVRDC